MDDTPSQTSVVNRPTARPTAVKGFRAWRDFACARAARRAKGLGAAAGFVAAALWAGFCSAAAGGGVGSVAATVSFASDAATAGGGATGAVAASTRGASASPLR